MKPVSALYKKLLADREHTREVNASVAGVEYGPDKIKACSTYCDVLSDFEVGGCKAQELDLTFEATGTIPRAAMVSVFYRLVRGSESSEWVPGGVFYVDTRSFDEYSGWLTVHGVDGMMRTEAVWWDASEDAGEWPMKQTAAAADIAQCMGVQLDSRSVIDQALTIDFPNDMTMREALSEIAAANGGSWFMSGDGNLLLTPLGGLPPETRFLVDDEDGGAILFGSVRILV